MTDQEFMEMILRSPQTLTHYGVLGMKWGIRKDRNAERRAQRASARKERQRQKTLNNPRLLLRNLDKFTESEVRQAMRNLRLKDELTRMSETQLRVGERRFRTVSTVLRTASDLSRVYNSPIGKAVQEELKRKTGGR